MENDGVNAKAGERMENEELVIRIKAGIDTAYNIFTLWQQNKGMKKKPAQERHSEHSGGGRRIGVHSLLPDAADAADRRGEQAERQPQRDAGGECFADNQEDEQHGHDRGRAARCGRSRHGQDG